MKNFDESIFAGGREKVKRREKRKEKKRRSGLQTEVEEEKQIEEEKKQEDCGSQEEREEEVQKHELDITTDELKELQALDPTLSEVRQAAKITGPEEGIGFFYRDNLLYKRWIPTQFQKMKTTTQEEKTSMAIEQLVLPKKCRRKVLEMAHSIPLAGHLGKKKTTDRILQRFYWPTMYKDIAEFCRTCESCQKTSGRKEVRVPLIPLPIISQPFQRIAMDIVGPLPRSRRGNRYVLVVCDYATRIQKQFQ